MDADFYHSNSEDELLTFIQGCQEKVAGRHGIIVLVEPLGSLQTNFSNTMVEVRAFLNRDGKDNPALMISLRELTEIDLTLEDFSTNADIIRHVHFENPAGNTRQRVAPRPDNGIDNCPFMGQLSHIEYCGTISLPQGATEQIVEYCRRLWKNWRSRFLVSSLQK